MTYRVVQWATGAVGRFSLQQIIDDPELELAGVWVSGPAKHGKDAGELCGRPPTGVTATSSRDAIQALDADIVIHCPAPLGAFDDDVAIEGIEFHQESVAMVLLGGDQGRAAAPKEVQDVFTRP